MVGMNAVDVTNWCSLVVETREMKAQNNN
jgi:hypothetical protein